MEKSKLVLKYKKDGRLSNATLFIKKKFMEQIGVTDNILFKFQDKKIILEARENLESIEKIEKVNGKVVVLIRNLKIPKDRKINIPLGILSEFGVNPEKNNYIKIDFSEKKLFLTLLETTEKSMLSR